jgi:hypothetical protein
VYQVGIAYYEIKKLNFFLKRRQIIRDGFLHKLKNRDQPKNNFFTLKVTRFNPLKRNGYYIYHDI